MGHAFKGLRNRLQWSLSHWSHGPSLKKLLAGRRVLIVGAGPSASELPHVPADTAVLTCNSSLKLFAERGRPRVDLYYFHKRQGLWKTSGLQELIKNIEIGIFISNLPKLVRIARASQRRFHDRPDAFVDSNRNNFYLKRLLGPRHIRPVNGIHWTSAGVRLLQYALYFKAREIFLIGIDQSDGYFWGEKKREQVEQGFEQSVLDEFSKRFSNVFSLSEKSPITRYFPFRSL